MIKTLFSSTDLTDTEEKKETPFSKFNIKKPETDQTEVDMDAEVPMVVSDTVEEVEETEIKEYPPYPFEFEKVNGQNHNANVIISCSREELLAIVHSLRVVRNLSYLFDEMAKGEVGKTEILDVGDLDELMNEVDTYIATNEV